LDLNTDPNYIREVKLIVKIKPSADRQRADVNFQASSRLAPDAPGSETLYLTKGGAFIANARQMTFDEYKEDVTELDAAKGGEK
jgi:hypothetical protein